MHGVIAKKDGGVVDVKIGEDADDPVFCISDLLIHLANQQMGKKANEVVEGEALDDPSRQPPAGGARRGWRGQGAEGPREGLRP